MIQEELCIPRELCEPIDAVVPSGMTHIGFVATNITGHVLITQPPNPRYGTTATFSKVKVQDGEKPHETLTRCFRQQVGSMSTGIYAIPSVWITSNARQFYFAGMINSTDEYLPSDTIRGLRWCNVDEAKRLLNQSQNAESLHRDLGLLAAVSNMCLFPGRRILLMVRELHMMGFERLRAAPYSYDNGAWRCAIVPAAWTLKERGGWFKDLLLDYEQFLPEGSRSHHHTYSEAHGQRPFNWEGAEFADSRELAHRFIKEKSELAFAGWGPDPEYVRWYRNALELTAPNGLWESDGDSIRTIITSARDIPLPPPGFTGEHELEDFSSRVRRRR